MKIFYIQFLKFLSCISVVFIHVSAVVVQDFKLDNSLGFNLNLIANLITRFAVPIFFMISGTFVLKKADIPIKQFYKKYILKLVILLLFWVTFYTYTETLFYPLSENVFTLKQIIKNLFFTGGKYQLWFLYTLIGCYMIFPILITYLKNTNKKNLNYFIFILFSFKIIIPFIVPLIPKNLPYINTLVYLSASYFFYCILGYYFTTYKISKKLKCIIYFMGIFSLISLIGLTYLKSIKANELIWSNYEQPMSPFPFFISIALFLFCKNLFNKNYNNKFVSFIAKYSLGIYLLHPFIIDILIRYNFITLVNNSTTKFFIFGSIICILSCLAISFILSKIPLLKKLI